MADHLWNWEMWQLLGLMLTGGGLVALGLIIADHRRQGRVRTDLGIPGNLPGGPGINMARIPVGGDIAGLVVVVGVVLAFMPMMWGWW